MKHDSYNFLSLRLNIELMGQPGALLSRVLNAGWYFPGIRETDTRRSHNYIKKQAKLMIKLTASF